VEGKEVKPVAIDNTAVGAISSQVFGIIKENWKLVEASSERERRLAMMAFDAKPTTYWQSKDSSGIHFLAIDLGKKYSIKGFAYMPQTQHANGMMAKGVIKVSADGMNWQDVETFEFGNLVNDRSSRNHYFQKPIDTRYIRIEAAQMAGTDMSLAIAELDFFE
jgi:alpha-L-fucosidase